MIECSDDLGHLKKNVTKDNIENNFINRLLFYHDYDHEQYYIKFRIMH